MFSYVGYASAQNISEAQEEKENLKNELKEAQELIDHLKDSKENIQETVKKLDAKLKEISNRINELEEQLGEKQVQVTDTQEELEQANLDRQKQYEDMKLRIQFMYENSSNSFLEQLLSSRSIAEFLNHAEYITKISQYDRNMLLKYEDTVNSVAQMETQLETELGELEEMKQQVQEEQKTVVALMEAKKTALKDAEGDITDAQEIAKVYEAEIEAQDEMIAQIQAAEEERLRKEKEQEEQRLAQEAEQRKKEEETANNAENQTPKPEDNPSDSGSSEGKPEVVGAFTWPCPSSKRITSDYGPRTSPTEGASSYHKGIDIGASYGADIVAAADGTVIFAGHSNSAGNYLTVNHGNGMYTVYMHCSSLTASKGQKVSRGQIIAKVGSTGFSTGNHLHFGVSINGEYVNPWNYL